ncbi:sialate O-acetylesterase [Mariniflexile ostreae]|uniref:Sialate O-acetylesterase n=1 Tax=Mariniflexile ostreae TaxID=1520892 RepID=A0ABV5FD07_9FLAO
MMNSIKVKFSYIVFFVLIFNTAFAFEIELPSIFSNGMVLQQGQKVPVWGTTKAHAVVEVFFAEQKKKIKADAQGNWRVDLDALKASSKSRALTITAQYNNEVTTLKLVDVLVGEVWLCSGQSNMYRPFRMLIGEAVEPKYEPIADYLRNEAATANDPLFRQFKVGQDFSVFEEKTKGRGAWSKAIPGQVNEFSGTAYFFGRELRRKLNVPVAVLSCNLGATKIEPWMPLSAYQSNERLEVIYNKELAIYSTQLATWEDAKVNATYQQTLTAWEAEVKQSELEGSRTPIKPRKPVHPSRDRQIPTTLYNAMVHPLIPFAIKGAIWYQGESNTSNFPEDYGLKLSALIENWRTAWGQDTLYFYYCQLANYKMPNEQPVGDDDGWAVLSDQMRRVLKVPNTGMAVLNDVGEAKDIHPKNKIDVGKRLSLWALNQAYGKKLVFSGPLYQNSEIKGFKIVVAFNHVGSGLMVGEKHLMNPAVPIDAPLKGFQICGKEGQWKWAKAKIISKNKIEVWHDDIQNPIEVRYAWSSNPEGANLYNKEGLPASLFKTQH